MSRVAEGFLLLGLAAGVALSTHFYAHIAVGIDDTTGLRIACGLAGLAFAAAVQREGRS